MKTEHKMDIRFWGVRGSLAAPLTNADLTAKLEAVLKLGLLAKLTGEDQVAGFVRQLPWYFQKTAGGDTSCVEVQAGNTLIILDAGTGIRPLGLNLLRKYGHSPVEGHILLSHTHWDHVCGIPFFEPAFIPGSRFTVYGPFPDLKKRIDKLQYSEFFPVSLAKGFSFSQLKERDRFQLGDVGIQIMPMNHPGGSYAYRITSCNKTMVYATDSEYKELSAEALRPYINFFKDADMVIFDAQYTMLENVEKENWGHSNVFSGIDIAVEAKVKKLFFTHHDPAYDDQKLWSILQIAREYLSILNADHEPELYLAVEGETVSV